MKYLIISMNVFLDLTENVIGNMIMKSTEREIVRGFNGIAAYKYFYDIMKSGKEIEDNSILYPIFEKQGVVV